MLAELGFICGRCQPEVVNVDSHSTITHQKTMKRSKARDIEKSYPVKEFVTKLRRLADSLESGRAFTIAVAGERLRIPADAVFNIEHEREGLSEELEFQLRWKRDSKSARTNSK